MIIEIRFIHLRRAQDVAYGKTSKAGKPLRPLERVVRMKLPFYTESMIHEAKDLARIAYNIPRAYVAETGFTRVPVYA